MHQGVRTRDYATFVLCRDRTFFLPFAQWGLGGSLLIAGPCSAESREQVLAAEGIGNSST